jgi:ABC-type polysaccharide/polyol phosphate transport system ATPase subunit
MGAHISLKGVSLAVPLYVQPERRARSWAGMLLGAAFDPPRRVYAHILKDISFDAVEGDRIAILGRNGAGKSTLLRVLNQVYPPSSGRLSIHGSCQALLNMSLGFNPDATVRENIFLRGTAMRIRASSLRDKIEPILEFAGLQEKSSHRLRTLSSGQKMRLGFAISTSVQHDIILMDEWVGAGDSAFMAKAKARMLDHMSGSQIVMLASHSVGLLRDICNKGIVLEQGQLVHAGDIGSALSAYHELMDALRSDDEGAMAGEGQLVYGCAEKMVLVGGHIHVEGWLTSTTGMPASGLALEVGGVRYPAVEVSRSIRPDVMRHFGLRDRACGFHARFVVPHVTALHDLGRDLRVLGGMQTDQPSSPLRIAPAIAAALRGAA